MPILTRFSQVLVLGIRQVLALNLHRKTIYDDLQTQMLINTQKKCTNGKLENQIIVHMPPEDNLIQFHFIFPNCVSCGQGKKNVCICKDGA